MIKFLRFSAQNLLWYADVDVRFNKQGLVLITGKNGVGKSLLFDAVQDAIFKTTPRGMRKSSLAGTEAFYTMLKARVHGDLYVIEYFRNHKRKKNGYRITKNGEPDTPHGIPACERYVKQVFGLSEHEWSTIYFSQRAMNTLVEGSNTERQAYLDRLFNIVQYDDVINRIRDEVKVLKAQTAEADNLYVLLEDVHQEMREHASLEDLNARVDDISEKVRAARKYLRQTESEIDDAETEVERQRKRKDLVERFDALPKVKPVAVLKERLRSLRSQVREKSETKSLLAKRDEYKRKLAQLEKPDDSAENLSRARDALRNEHIELKNLIPTLERRDDLRKDLEDLEKPTVDLSVAQEKERKATDRVSVCRSRVSELSTQIETMEDLEVGSCPTCGQEITADNLVSHINELKKDLSKTKADLAKSKDLAASASHQVSLHNARARIEAQLKQYDSDADLEVVRARSQEVRSFIKEATDALDVARTWESLTEKMRDVAVIDDDIESVTAELDKLEAKISKTQASIEHSVEAASLEEQILAIPLKKASAIKEELERLSKARDIAQAELDTLEGMYTKATVARDTVDNLTSKAKRLQGQYDSFREAKDKLWLLENALKAFRVLKQRKRHAILENLLTRLQQYAPLLFDPHAGISFGMSENEDSVGFMCHREGYEPYDIRTMSGGEKSRITIALLFTLPLMVSPRKRSNMLILDEVDSALDAQGKEMLTHSVFPTLRKLFPTIFFISHNNDINEGAFDQVWNVRRKNGVSRIDIAEKEYE